VADHPVRIAESEPDEEDEQGEQIEEGHLRLKAFVNGGQDDECVEDGEDQHQYENLLWFVLLVEGHHWVVADDDGRVSEEADIEEVVGDGDRDGEEQDGAGGFPGVDGHHEGNREDDLVVGEVGELD